jgi:CRP/FNR family transcriptional regulator, cyclic AMP receptor protein
MTRDNLIAALKATDVFRGASDATLGRIAERMRERRFYAGQLLFARGDTGDRLYYVVSGRLRLSVVTEEGRELAFRQATAGDVIGEIALLDGGARTADATALDAVMTMSLDRTEALDLVKSDPGFGNTVIAFLCRRLRDTSQQLENIALFPIEIRLARFFLLLVQAKGETAGAKVLIEPRMSQSELALLIGASRPKVNLGLGQLEDLGALKREGDGFLCTKSRLRAIAGVED